MENPLAPQNNNAFSVLDSFPYRILICKNQYALHSTLEIIQKENGMEDRIELLDEIHEYGDGEYRYTYFSMPGKDNSKIYTFLCKDKKSGFRTSNLIYHLVSILKTSCITYVHPSAIRNISIPKLAPFLPIVFTNTDEIQSYFTGENKLVFQDTRELLFFHLQKQEYIKTQLTSPIEYRKRFEDSESTENSKKKQSRKPKKNGNKQEETFIPVQLDSNQMTPEVAKAMFTLFCTANGINTNVN